MNIVIIQIIGAIAFITLTLSYYKKNKKEILFLQIVSYILFSIHFYLLSGITGALCNFIGLFALIAIYLLDKYNLKKGKKIISLIFIILLIVINIINFQNVYSIFPMIASVVVIISFLSYKEDLIRNIGVISAICWLIYAIVYKSYISIAFEVFTLIGIFDAIIKVKKSNKRGENMKEKSCGCIIIDEDTVLLIKQTKGHWGVPKGHVEDNETEVETALRETKEETNIDVEIDSTKRYTMEYVNDKGNLKEVVLFVAKPISKDVLPQETEVSEIKWLPYSEAIETISYDNSKELLTKVLKDLGKI